jgi:hypothetical protein
MRHSVLLTIAAVTFAGGAFAQKSEVGKRAENQQQRIAQGVKSGSLTARGTANLETKESAINHEVKADRSANGGKLTAQEKHTVNQQQDKLSNRIYADKHNAAHQNYGSSEVGQRQTNQQQRIGNGIASGNLSAGQAAHLENNEAGLNQEVRADRNANGGTLTAGEKGQVNQQQNQLSGQIYNAKH